ncbi:MAG: MarR family transcriptional regulator [Nanoarchaeota archaeon]
MNINDYLKFRKIERELVGLTKISPYRLEIMILFGELNKKGVLELTPKEVSSKRGISHSSTNNCLEGLTNKGYLRKQKSNMQGNPDVVYSLTKKGSKKYNQIINKLSSNS